MPDHADFLAAILADSESDLPRLAYADWLQRQGDPRGEFIRLQCELTTIDERDPKYSQLKGREEALLDARRAELLGPLAGYSLDVRFERGLASSLTLATELFLDKAAALVGLAPLREVCLKQAGGRIARLAACPQLDRISRLWLTFNDIDAAEARVLAESPHLGQLTTLNLGHNRIGDAGLQALAASTRLPRLEHLWLSKNQISDHGVLALASAPLLGQLRTLRLGSNPLGDPGVLALAASSGTARLEGLHLGSTNLADQGALALAHSPHLARLDWLVVKKCKLSDDAERQLRSRFGARLNREAFS